MRVGPSKMPLHPTALGALLLVAGCATSVADRPASPPAPAHAPSPTAAKPPPEHTQPEEAPAIATRHAAPPADEPPSPPAAASVAPSAPRADPFGDVGMKEVNEKDWLAGVRRGIAQREGIAPADVRFSPGFLRAAFVRSSSVPAPARPGRRVPPRRHEIVVVDNQGRHVLSFRPIAPRIGDEPPGDLQFLSEERLAYEVVSRSPPTATAPPKRTALPKTKSRAAARSTRAGPKPVGARGPSAPPPPLPPPRLFVIQPLAPGARPIRCQGLHFTFTREHDRLAFVGGPTGTAFVAVDGAQVYPRRGRTIVASAPAWSKDGRSLAFLETPPAHPPRLVLVAALDNPTGDVTWDLPADAPIEGATVSWTGSGKLIVKKAATRPIFSASFVTER
jgi:hypothetical protein